MIHPSVIEVAVVASPDPPRVFVPNAFLTLKPQITPSRELALEIFRSIRDRITPYRRPRIIQFMEELPKIGGCSLVQIFCFSFFLVSWGESSVNRSGEPRT